MDAHSLKILEFDKIKELVASRTSSELGRNAVLSLEPLGSESEIRRLLRETTEAKELLALHPGFSPGGCADAFPVLARARIEGSTLTPQELWEIGRLLTSALTCRDFILKEKKRARLLSEIAGRIADLSAIEDSIKKSVNEDGEVLDGASATLRKTRHQARELRSRTKSALENIIRDNPGVVQEQFVTLRDGRYVLPLLPMFKRRIAGIVHDQSSSGATLYVEPYSAVHLNNRLSELAAEEEKEIRRILSHLSAMVRDRHRDIEVAAEAFSQIDMACAKARFSADFDCVEPEFSQDGEIRLLGARHPFLVENHKKLFPHKKLEENFVVPIDILLRGDYKTLLITGPNTGGKTVALKTVGILHAMAHAGVHIVAKEGSTVALLDDLFADIGDEQSIEQNLSTFSSHIKNIARILKESTPRSLVLLDELGSGTEPSEGGAIGIAILEYLLERRVKTAATTHHNAIKTYACGRPGVQSTTVEFDEESLRPLYTIRYGVPGSSKALLVAEKLGLPKEVLDTAGREESRGPDYLQQALKKIELQRSLFERERENARAAASALRALEQQSRTLLGRLESEMKAAGRRVRLKGEKFFSEAGQEISSVISELRDQSRGPKKAVGAGRKLAEIRDRFDEEFGEAKAGAVQQAGGAIHPGYSVRLKSLGLVGVVEGEPSSAGVVNVRVGRAIMRVPATEVVSQAESPQEGEKVLAERRSVGGGIEYSRPEQVSAEINVIGCRVDEALERIDKYLDDAALAGLSWVRIIHGKGGGRLRVAVADFLKRHPLVKSFQTEAQERGGAGVTAVEID